MEERRFIKSRLKITEAIEDYLSKNGALDGLSDAQKEEAIELLHFLFLSKQQNIQNVLLARQCTWAIPFQMGQSQLGYLKIFEEPQRDFLKELPTNDLQEIKSQLQTAVNQKLSLRQ